jgi:hypothetical protein
MDVLSFMGGTLRPCRAKDKAVRLEVDPDWRVLELCWPTVGWPTVGTVSVEIHLDADRLRVEPKGWDRVWAMRSAVEVALSDVVAVSVQDRQVLADQLAVRLRGTTIPGRVLAGSYSVWPHARVEKGDRHFWVTRRAPQMVAIDTAVAWPRRIVIEVDDPYAMVRRIDEARQMAARNSSDEGGTA